ncbi:MAG: hypothetical protein JXR52_13205 [Bacteroidales bacterium]|nr:hypothetical protein [Bacteroidales bacterium]MBN2699776.1 hypothetical protein [Bacteroidales bacterium]
MMSEHIKYIWKQLVASSLSILAGLLLITCAGVNLIPNQFIALVAAMTGISVLSYLVIARGIQNSKKEDMIFLLGGIGLKLILYLLLILIFWLVTKNITKPFIIAFFLLYLIFTFLMVFSLLRLLKNKEY